MPKKEPNEELTSLWDYKIYPRTKYKIENSDNFNLNGLYCIGLFEINNITIAEQINKAGTFRTY